jgi:TP901 family phage tail tape measure protein
MAINIPANVQIQNANQAATYLQGVLQGAVNNVQFNLGGAGGSRTLRSLSQPLGRLTGQADEFTKSLDAANARVLAFGASVGIVNAVSNAFKSLVNSTIEVEKAITAISVVGDKFAGKTKELSQGLFNIAKATGQSFSEVSKAALEFSRQGLLLEDTLSRTQDALILTRLTGLDAAKSVDGLTAAVNAFSKAGLSTTQIINKLAAVDQAFAVSSADLIEGFNRSAAVAQNAGVTFDELAGIITALQQETSRGGAVIGNALKTIFTRLQDTSTLNRLNGLGIAVKDLQNNLLPARKILQNLATDVEGLGKITQAGIFKDVAGTFQINQLISLLGDLNKQNSVAADATLKSAGATNEAFIANEKLNQSLDAILNKVATTGKQLGSVLGELGLTDNLKIILDGIGSFLENANSLLQGDDLGSKFAKGLVKGIGAVLTGPGLGLFLAIIGKLSLDLAKFGAQSLKTFFGIGKAAGDQKQIQESIVQTLLRNQNILNSIVTTQGGQNAQALKFLGILNQQATAMKSIEVLSSSLASAAYSAGYRQTGQGLQRRSAGGYLPAQEAADVRRGVGGASPSSKVVAIPNFAFGGGKRGTMIANTSEYIVPNYAGGGSAIFNQDMVKTMGLPPGAKKISAAGGFIPNFASVESISKINPRVRVNLNKSTNTDRRLSANDTVNLRGNKFNQLLVQKNPNESESQYENRVIKNLGFLPNNNLKYQGSSAVDGYKIKGDSIDLLEVKSGSWNSLDVLNKFLRALPENYGTKNPLDRWKKGKDDFVISALLASPTQKTYKPTQKRLFSKSSGGYIPNFAETNKDLAVFGLYGRNNGEINGSPVYTLQGQSANLTKNIEKEYQVRIKSFVRGYSQELANQIGIKRTPREIVKSLQQTSQVSGFIFEDILNQLAGPEFDSNRISGGARADFPVTPNLRKVFGATGTQPYAEVKLDPYTTDSIASIKAKQAALAAGALGPKSIPKDEFNQLRARAIELGIGKSGRIDVKTQSQRNAFIKELIGAGIIKSGYGASADQTKAIKRALGMASDGYVPNFAAAALQQAIAREKSAGLLDSQIYVDQSSALKSPMNPMGLMVANRRDEPAGGFQGIARARKEGMNPKLYGAAGGFVPNFAPNPIDRQAFEAALPQSLKKSMDKFADLIDEINKKLAKNKITQEDATKELETFVKGVRSNLNPSKGAGLKAVQAAQNQLITPVVTQKSAGDALARVFALQSALFGLTEVVNSVAGEGSEFADTFKKVDGILTGVVSAATLLTAGLGPLGIALAVVTGGFNIVKSLWPNAIQQMSEAFGGLSEAGQRASQSLNQFGENVNRGGISADEALAQSIKKAEEAQLRAEASSKGVNLQTSEGKQKTPEQLARDLLVNQTTTSFKSIGLNLPNGQKTGAQRKPGIGDKIRSVLSGGDDPISPEDFAGVQEFKSLADFNEETRNILIGSFADTVISLNKTGLVALGKVLQQKDKDFKPKDFENLIKKDQVAEYRSALLAQIFKGKEVQEIVNKAIAESTKDGKFDERALQTELDKAGLSSISADLAKFVKDLIPSVEAVKLENQIQIRLDDFLLSYQNFSNEINRGVGATTALFEGALSSQAFSSLSVGRQSQLKTQLDRFKFTTASQKSERDIAGEARVLAANQAKNLAATQGNIDLQNRLDKFATTFSNLDSLESELNSFAKEVTLAGKESETFKQQVADLINKNKDFQSSREVEKTLLNFSIQERENELAAIQTFYQGLSEFDKGIREKEGELRKLDFDKALADQTAQFEKEFAQITSSSPQELRARTRGVENTKVREELRISGKQSEIQAKIERDRALNTLENITALNKNTIALEELLKQITVENLTKELESIKNKEYVDDFGEVFSGSTDQELARAEAIKIQLKALNNPLASNATATKNPLSYLNTIKSPGDIETALSGIVNEQEKAKYRQIFETYFDRMQQVGKEEARRLALLENGNNQEDTLNRIRDSYIDDISQELTSLRQSQTSPKSRGEYQATERQINRLVQQEGMTPEGVRDYRSSFGYGLDKGIEELEKRTLDYKQELGVEIPRLFSSNLAQGLNDAISGAKSLKEALSDAATSFFQEITRKNISNLADLVTGGIGGFFTKKAAGGLITGGSGTKDDVPAMLMGGEYVMKKSAVNKYGKGFLDALNNGKMRGYATGGIVDPQTFPTQTGRGGFFTPGDYGQGAITGKNELLTFATQSFTSGQYDYMGGFGMSGATVGLEPESARLSSFGRENSPMFERVQQSKDEAFRVYLDGLQKEKEYAELLEQIAQEKKARKKQLKSSFISALVTSALSYGGNVFATGAKNATAASLAAGGKGGFLSGVKGGFSNLRNFFSPSSALKLSPTAQLLKEVGVSSYKDLYSGKAGLEGYTKILKSNSNFGKKTNFPIVEPVLPSKVGPEPMTNTLLPPVSRASGGLISGGSNIKDDVPAMLTGGEFVLNNRATQRIGLQNLNKLNSGQPVSGEGASAEMTQALISKLDELIQATQNSSSENVVVNVSTSEAGGQNQENSTATEKDLGKKIRQAVLDVIAQEKRLGGSLEKAR